MSEPEDVDLPLIDTPVNLRPDLSMYGIQEVDRGICLDTAENRQTLRHNKLSWLSIYDVNGRPTNTLEVRSREMIEAQSLNTLESKKSLLEDPRDRNSDYLRGLDLLYAGNADKLVPSWILAATRTWEKTLDEREKTGNLIRPNLVAAPGRCSAIKSDGVRCLLWHSGRKNDQTLCRIHLGAITNSSAGAIEKARNRIQQAAPMAVDVLEEMMYATSEPVRLKAATEMLDRAGVRGGVEIDMNATVEARPASDILMERLKNLKKGEEKKQSLAEAANHVSSESDIIDAEVVEDPQEDTEND